MLENELSNTSLTGGEKEGRGLFDELMRTVESHLIKEFEAERITEHNYGTTYLGAMQSTMQTAAQYLIQQAQTNQQVKLIAQQVLNAEKEAELLDKQIEKIDEEILLARKQVLKMDSEIALIDAQVVTQGKQQEVLDEQVINAQKDVEVKDAQITYQGKQGALVDQQTVNAASQDDQIKAQTAKLGAEQAVLEQRKLSEEAQIKDTVNGETVTGILGKQKVLYTNQAEGYIRDAEQKAAKIMNDTFITRVSTDWDNPSASTAGLDDGEVAKVMSVLKSGVGA